METGVTLVLEDKFQRGKMGNRVTNHGDMGTFFRPGPSPGPRPIYTALTFYILSVEMAISLRLLEIPVFCYGI